MEAILVRSRDNQNFVVFHFQEFQSNPDYARDLVFRLETRSLGITGVVSGIWFQEREFDDFVSRLSSLEERRQGLVRLESLSLGEFWMEFLTPGRPGRIYARGRLTQQTSLIAKESWSSVGFDFELDPSMLPEIVKKFRSLRDRSVLDSDL